MNALRKGTLTTAVKTPLLSPPEVVGHYFCTGEIASGRGACGTPQVLRRAMVLLALVICTALTRTWAVAESPFERPLRPGEGAVILHEQVSLTAQPIQAIFIVEYPDGETERLEAVPVEPFTITKGSESTWQIGALYTPRFGSSQVRLATIVVDTAKRYIVVPFREIDIENLRSKNSSIDELRSVVLKRKEALRSWEMQLAEQQGILQRLRADAEVIGGVGRIIDAKEEKQRLDLESASIDGQIENLKRLVELARTRPPPKNITRREQQLSSQLVELAAAAKSAEMGEGGRRGAAERQLQQRLSLIEETRYEDLDLLRRQVQSLEAERAQRGRAQG